MLRTFTTLSLAAVFGAFLAGCKGEGTMEGSGKALATGDLSARETLLVNEYDALAKAILKVHPNETEAQKQKELQIMGDLISIYKAQAENAFAAAKAAQGDAQMEELKRAIDAVGKLAMEGDNRVDGIKKDLQKGGHHHSKAEDSDEEYIFINSKAKKALNEDLKKLRSLLAGGKPAPAAEIDAIAKDVFATVDAAMKMKT